MSLTTRTVVLATVLLCGAALAACGEDSAAGPDGEDDGLEVVAAFYPLEFVARRVGGGQVDVRNLTPVGAEPHDLELSPRDIVGLAEADLVVHLAGFTPALDEALEQTSTAVLDVGPHVRLLTTDGDALEDPHFWLDPTRLAEVAPRLADELGRLDPADAEGYAARAAQLVDELTALDAELAAGLATCERRELVTSHAAFGYLADRYDLEQVPIAGLSPHEEPSSRALAEVTALVRDRGVTTIFVETLVDPDIAETVANEAGVATAALDPLEGLAEDADGDYLSVMRANLETLRTGLGCS